MPGQSVPTSGAKGSICSPVSPSKPAYGGSNFVSPQSNVVRSPYYVPLSAGVKESPCYKSASSDGKQVISPDYNPASPGYVPTQQFVNLVDEPIKEEADESD